VIVRRVPFVVLGATVVTLVVMDKARPEPVTPSTYGAKAIEQSTPAVLRADLLSTSWFCPGGPTTSGRSTSITVFNTNDDPREVSVSAVTAEGASGARHLSLAPRNRQVVNLGELAAGEDTAATVVAYGGGVAVEQTVVGRSGVDTTPCADSASRAWYLADGSTTADAALRLVLYNPFPNDAVVDISLTTVERTVEPPNLQGAVVPGHSVRLVDLAAAAQREEVVSTSVVSRGAQVVASRIESADNPSRRGFWTKLAAAQPAQTWWFPDGEKGHGADERFVLFNPGDADASVELSFLPAGGTAPAAPPAAGGAGDSGDVDEGAAESLVPPVSDVVPAGGFLVVDVNAQGAVPAGRHSTLINVVGDQTPVVAERVLSRPVAGRPATTVLLGSQLTVTDWYVTQPAASGGAGTLVIMNSAGLATTAAINAIGPAGAVPVRGLESVAVPAGGSATVSVPATSAGFPLLIEAAQPVVVEWHAPMAAGDKISWVTALAFPVVGG
jgi:hypothetical protein